MEGPVSADSPRHGNWYKQDSTLEAPALALGRQIIRLRARVWQILRCEKGRFSPCLQGDNVQHIPLKCSEMETGEMNLYAASGSMCMKMQLLETSNLYRFNRKLWNTTEYIATTVVSKKLSQWDTSLYVRLLEFCAEKKFDSTLLASQGHVPSKWRWGIPKAQTQ